MWNIHESCWMKRSVIQDESRIFWPGTKRKKKCKHLSGIGPYDSIWAPIITGRSHMAQDHFRTLLASNNVRVKVRTPPPSPLYALVLTGNYGTATCDRNPTWPRRSVLLEGNSCDKRIPRQAENTVGGTSCSGWRGRIWIHGTTDTITCLSITDCVLEEALWTKFTFLWNLSHIDMIP